MKKAFGLLGCIAALSLVLGLAACNTDVDNNSGEKKYTGFRIETRYALADESAPEVAGALIKVYDTYSDGTEILVSYTNYDVSIHYVNGTDTDSDTLKKGKNTVVVTYKGEERSVEIWKATHDLTSYPVEVTDYTGSHGAASSTVHYYKFGDYPQSLVDSDNVPELSPETASNGYYIGSDGNYYVKTLLGDVYAVEPIIWCDVCDDFDYDGHFENSEAASTCSNKGSLLVAEKILDCVSYFDDAVSESYEITKGQTAEKALADLLAAEEGHLRTVNGKTVYSNNYANSEIRAFLNGLSYQTVNNGTCVTYLDKGFYQVAFSSTAKGHYFNDVTVLNDGTSGTDISNEGIQPIDTKGSCVIDLTSENTSDRVFLLSEYEATNTNLGYPCGSEEGDATTRKTATSYAAAKGAVNDTWFLRTPYYKNGCSVRYVTETGYQYPNILVTDGNCGVVPAIVTGQLND